MKSGLKKGDLFLNRGKICMHLGQDSILREGRSDDWFMYFNKFVDGKCQLFHNPSECLPLNTNICNIMKSIEDELGELP